MLEAQALCCFFLAPKLHGVPVALRIITKMDMALDVCPESFMCTSISCFNPTSNTLIFHLSKQRG